MLFSAGRGTGFQKSTLRDAMVQELGRQGIMVVKVPWTDSWLEASPNETVGPARLACRPATVIKWVHDNLYDGLEVHPSGVGRCGFCLSGDSGGASQVAYALSHYGLADIIDAALLGSGPPHAGLPEGCLGDIADRSLWYRGFSTPVIDASYGALTGDGPCARHDASFDEQWIDDSVDTGGSDYDYPSTRVVFIFGSDDHSEGPPHGTLFMQRLQEEGSPLVQLVTVPGMGHLTGNSSQGIDTVTREVLGSG